MFYIEHTMKDGYIIRTYHKEGDSLATTRMIQKEYNDGFIPEWYITIDPDRKMAEVTFESFSIYETVGKCHCEEVSWINAEIGSNYKPEDVSEYQIQYDFHYFDPDDVCRNGKPINECTCC